MYLEVRLDLRHREIAIVGGANRERLRYENTIQCERVSSNPKARRSEMPSMLHKTLLQDRAAHLLQYGVDGHLIDGLAHKLGVRAAQHL